MRERKGLQMIEIKAEDVVFACAMWVDILNKVDMFDVDDERYQHAIMAVDIAHAHYLKIMTAYKEQVERDQKLHNQIVEEVAELLGTKDAKND